MDETTVALPPEGEQPLTASWTMEAFAPDRIKRLVEDLIPDATVRGERQFGLHIIDGQDPRSDIGRSIEAEVFDEFFDNDLKKMKAEYGPYDTASTFLTVIDYEAKEPVGVIRVIRPSEAGLKSLNDLAAPSSPWFQDGDSLEERLQEIGDDPEHTVDISTMAIMPTYRSNHADDEASAALYSTCVRWSLDNGYNRWVTIVDRRIYDMMQSWGEPFQAFAGTDWAPYLDSEKSLPVHTELISGLQKIKEFDQAMTEKTGQAMDVHGLYTRGIGLEEKFVLPAFDDTVQ